MLDAFAIALSVLVSLRRLLAARRERAVKTVARDFGLLDQDYDGGAFGAETATLWFV